MLKKLDISILKIKELSYLLDIDNSTAIDISKLFVTFGFDFRTDNIDSDIIALKVKVSYIYNIEDHKREVLNVSSDNIFKVSDLNSIYVKNNSEFEMPEYLLSILVGTSLSSLRGIIAVRTANTVLENFPLQLVDMKLLLGMIKNKLPKNKLKISNKSPRKAP